MEKPEGSSRRKDLLRLKKIQNLTQQNSPKLKNVCSREHGLNGPLGQLAGVVLQLIGQDGASLRVQLLPPVDVSGKLRVPLVQGLHVHEQKILLRVSLRER